MNNDPGELHNLAKDEKYKSKLQQLTALLKKDMSAYGDDLDVTKPDWKK